VFFFGVLPKCTMWLFDHRLSRFKSDVPAFAPALVRAGPARQAIDPPEVRRATATYSPQSGPARQAALIRQRGSRGSQTTMSTPTIISGEGILAARQKWSHWPLERMRVVGKNSIPRRGAGESPALLTRSGSATSPISPPRKAGSIWPAFWTFTAAGSPAGP